MDQIIKAISADGFASIAAIDSRGLAERARIIHDPSPPVTAALGRILSAASIIGSYLKKPGASLTVRIDGGGPAGVFIAVSDDEGNVRGFVQNPWADAPDQVPGKLNVGGVVGAQGTLAVIKDFGEKESYTGTARLVSGEIAEDFAEYFAVSEQTPTACALGVLVGKDRSVIAAGGYIAQLLPGAPEEAADALERRIRSAGRVTDMLAGGSLETMLATVMDGLSPRIIERLPVGYKCNCHRERFLRALLSLGESELEDIRAKAEPIEMQCRFCRKAYVFDVAEIR